MAADEEEVLEEAEEEQGAKKGSSLLKILALVFSVVILIAGSVGATLYMTGSLGALLGDGSETDASQEHDAPEATKEATGEGAIYYALDPAFVVNYYDKQTLRYLQVTVEIMAYDEKVIEDVKKHTPVIRNNLVMLFSNIDPEVIKTLEGKKKLLADTLAEIRGIMEDKTGKPGVEEVYFTGFVTQ